MSDRVCAIILALLLLGLLSRAYVDQNARNVDKTLCAQSGGRWQPTQGFQAARCEPKQRKEGV